MSSPALAWKTAVALHDPVWLATPTLGETRLREAACALGLALLSWHALLIASGRPRHAVPNRPAAAALDLPAARLLPSIRAWFLASPKANDAASSKIVGSE